MHACVAQLVEHVLGKDEVTGSSPVASSEHDVELNGNGAYRRARDHHAGMHKLQTTQLLDHQEPEEPDRPRGVQEILPVV